ncbi:glycosyltransferase family 39 protein [Nonomuraea roseoviolacea]|uniref:4-amino-4-deoxy-L-arabinose transferase-like glycosyltransferase n=1 Tax=Nonomuraea roseoviolacea subsp. carminata TaxID=160689 RepID=A0ABT1KBF8_9ACTN|nr:glycosyltransferase family 39 protein [Nonomuraea roseoviolacea]MCP2350299.1 4-amino-4-deoxy-L-arabinose transferase-like glycosyltransferase [Nonomuraea roseoviolacea subsp. carminata]
MTTAVSLAGRRRASRRAAAPAPRWSRPALWAVLAAAFVLYAWALSGYANEYYAAAVLSGTKSWKAFFFGAVDAGSYITVDKPPFALWVMGLSARVFGFGTWSMLLPQAVAGVAAVALVHGGVLRAYGGVRQGHVAALLAAVVMTLTPITVAINRDNNPDTVLVLLLVLAAWFCLESLRTGRLRPLLLCALFVGLAFNTKMLQAYLVVPAFALAYLVCARGTVARRIGHLLAAGAVLAVSSAWWMVIVDLWPAGSRPYIGGSTDNSVRDLVIGYNGLGRIFGQGGPGGSAGFGGGASFGGESGAGRLFNDIMAGQISWLLPFCALALAFAALTRWTARRAAAEGAAGDPDGAPATSPSDGVPGGGDRDGASGAAWLVWGGWLAVHYVVFSFSSGTFHPYYTTAMAPAVAAITGMGGVLMWRAFRRSRTWAWVLPLAVAVTGGWSFAVLRRTPDFVPWLAWAVLAATVLAVAGLATAGLVLAGRGRLAARVAVGALAATLVAGLAGPAAYAVSPLGSRVNGTNPTAGPSAGRTGFGPMGGMPPGGMPPGQYGAFRGRFPEGTRPPQDGQNGQEPQADGRSGRMTGGPGGGVGDSMVEYLLAHQGPAEWLVAVDSAQQASSIILSTGKPVIAMGGFTGSDPAMTVDRLKELVSSGRLRYVLGGGDRGGPGRGDSEVSTWVRENCAAVDGQDGLHDCSAAAS